MKVMAKSSIAKKLYLTLMILNLVLVIGIFGVFTIASNFAKKESSKISQAKADLDTNTQTIDNYKILEATLNSNKDIEDIINKVLPTDKDQSEAIADLDKFSRDTNVQIQQIVFVPGTNKGTGKTFTSPSSIKDVSIISVNLSCSKVQYSNLLAFLRKIETTQRRMQVSSIDITPNSTNPTLLERVELKIDLYLKAGT
jgi:Tfp pilus assembly protein PilO